MKKLKLNESSSSSGKIRFSLHQLFLLLVGGLFMVSTTAFAGVNYQDQQEGFTISGTVTSDDIGPLPGAASNF